LKRNVVDLDSQPGESLAKLRAMRGVRYSLRPEMRRKALRPSSSSSGMSGAKGKDGKEQQEEQQQGEVDGQVDREEIGLIAQEIEELLPQVVHTGRGGFKSVAYSRLVPVLIEAVKEQQVHLEGQQQLIERQSSELEQLRSSQASMMQQVQKMLQMQLQQQKQLDAVLAVQQA
jgi:hypothetical protein